MNGRRGLRRLWRHPYVFVAALVLFASALTTVGATFAFFSSETENAASPLAGGWIAPATALSVTPSGYDAQLGWNPGGHGLDGQQLYGRDNGSSSTCPSSGYTQLATLASATTASTTDSSASLANPRSGINGHYVCYELISTRSGSNWTAAASFPATQLGLLLNGLAVNASVTADGTVDSGDVIQATFDQSVVMATPSSAAVVCESWTASGYLTIYLDDVAYGAGNTCSSSPSYRIALTGLKNGAGAAGTDTVTATVTTAAASPWTATWTLASTGQTIASGSATATPSSTLLSAYGGADQAAACTSAANGCTPAATGHGF